MESYTGRSMDPLLPVGESGRKKVPNTDYDVTQRYRSERHRTHVGSQAHHLVLSCSPATHLWLITIMIWMMIISGTVRRTASRASSDLAAAQSGSTVRSGPELASPTWETHLWVLCLRSQCKSTVFSLMNDAVVLENMQQHWRFSLSSPCLVSRLHAH